MDKKTLTAFIIIDLIIVALIAGGIYFWVNNKETESPQEIEQIDSSKQTSSLQLGYDYYNTKWDEIAIAVKEKSQHSDLISVNIPESADGGVYYITVSDEATGEMPDLKVKTTVFAFNQALNEFKELFVVNDNYILRTLGLDGNHLILVKESVDLGPVCNSVWHGDLHTLDITNPSELKAGYKVNQALLDKSAAEERSCWIDSGMSPEDLE